MIKNSLNLNQENELLITFDGVTKICKSDKTIYGWTKKELLMIAESWNIKISKNSSKNKIHKIFLSYI